jgi:hypothetical protein
MIKQVVKNKDDLLEAADVFNHELIANMTTVGGDEYATLGSLVYRQVELTSNRTLQQFPFSLDSQVCFLFFFCD